MFCHSRLGESSSATYTTCPLYFTVVLFSCCLLVEASRSW